MKVHGHACASGEHTMVRLEYQKNGSYVCIKLSRFPETLRGYPSSLVVTLPACILFRPRLHCSQLFLGRLIVAITPSPALPHHDGPPLQPGQHIH